MYTDHPSHAGIAIFLACSMPVNGVSIGEYRQITYVHH